jgi:hypothetical protein
VVKPISVKDWQARRGGEAVLHLFFLTSIVLASSCVAHALSSPFVFVHATVVLVIVRRVRVRMEMCRAVLLKVRIVALEVVAERVVGGSERSSSG